MSRGPKSFNSTDSVGNPKVLAGAGLRGYQVAVWRRAGANPGRVKKNSDGSDTWKDTAGIRGPRRTAPDGSPDFRLRRCGSGLRIGRVRSLSADRACS